MRGGVGETEELCQDAYMGKVNAIS